MNDTMFELTNKLVAMKTDPGNESELNNALDLVIAEMKDFTVEEFTCDGV